MQSKTLCPVISGSTVHDPDDMNRIKRVIQAAREDTEIIPHLNNYNPQKQSWDAGVGDLLKDANKRAALRDQVIRFFIAYPSYPGLSLDIESINDDAIPGYLSFIQELYSAMHARNLHLYVNVAALTPDNQLKLKEIFELEPSIVLEETKRKLDGSKNPLQVLRLKKKMGNLSNASSEIEFRGALGWMVGEEGRGVRTIIEMVSMTRFDCMIGSGAGMRMAVSQVMHHCRQRSAFGRKLIDQPLMRNVLADLALESEAAMTLTMRMARAMDHRDNEHEDLLVRLATAVGKYWICKRTPNHAYEAVECIGGSGVMEDSMMPRLYREAPINAIWEGSGNVQCLDVLRAMQKTPAVVEAFVAEVKKAKGGRVVPVGIIYIRASFNNTIVTITDMKGAVIAWSSAGRCQFKGSRRARRSRADCARSSADLGLEADLSVLQDDLEVGADLVLRVLALALKLQVIEELQEHHPG